ncbi:WD repeat-containing protein 89 [Kappamyces sp. JEL0829]|nr:WD repeat-containing protein 89 [Kappamyces sp. JEL0829]
MTRPFSLVSSINKTPANYCLEIAPNASRKAHFATSLSSGSIHLHDVNAFTAYQVIGPQTTNSVISHIQFDNSNPHLLWASTRENQVVLHDTRTTSAPVHTYRCPAPVLSFDLNANHSILAAGTELLGDDASILFYDVRASPSEAIATFNECHSDDVTQIQFHPSTPNAMVSGSTDGLVCLYDLTSMNEDDSLYQVIKENSVSKVGFFGPAFEYLYCSTHIETLSLWTFQNAESIVHYGDVRGASPDLSLDYCIDWTFDAASGHLFLQAGSQSGNIGILDVTLSGVELVYTLNHGHEDIVRSVYWNMADRFLVSGSEEGKLCHWRQ